MALPGMQTWHPEPILRSRPDVWTCPCEAKRLEDVVTVGCDSQEHWSLSNIVAKEVCWKKCVCGSINGRTVWQQKIDDFLTFWQSRQHSVENTSVVTSSGRGLFSALGRPVIYGFARYADMPSLGSKIQDLCFFHFDMLNFPRVLSK